MLASSLVDRDTGGVEGDQHGQDQHGSCGDAQDPAELGQSFLEAAEPDRHRLLVALVRDISARLETEQAILDQQTRLQVLEDRERLTRDLHDPVIQRLFAAGMGLQAVQSLFTEAAAAERVTETIIQIDATITELRSAIFRLNNPTPATVAAQLGDIIDRAEATLGYRPSLTLNGDPETISEIVVGQLLPTVTEALSNSARHANATTADITLTTTGSLVE